MKFNQLIIFSVLAASMILTSCSDSDSKPSTTDFKVNVTVPTGLPVTAVANKSFATLFTEFFITEVTADDVSDQLDKGNFKVAIVNAAGIVTKILTPKSLTQEPDGSWVVTVAGGTRVDCVIIADLSKAPNVKVGDKLPADAIYAPTATDAFEIDPRSTAAYQEFIDSVADNLNLRDNSGFTEAEVAQFVAAAQTLPLPDYTPGQTLDQYLAVAIPQLEAEIEREIIVVQNTDTTFSLADYFGNGGVLNWYEFFGTYARGQFSYDAATQTVTDLEQEYNGSNWISVPVNASADALILTSTGWVANADLDVVDSINSDGTVTLADSIVTSDKENISAVAVNIAAQSIRTFLPGFSDVLAANAVFSTGATAYQLSFTVVSDTYQLSATDTGAGVTTTFAADDVLGNSYLTLDSMLSASAATSTDPTQMNLLDISSIAQASIALELVGSGTTGIINIYQIDYGTTPAVATVIDTTTWERRSVQSTDLIVIDARDNVLGEADGEDYYLFAEYNGAVAGGTYAPAGSSSGDIEYVYNDTAANDINSNFNTNLLPCSYESPWDDIAGEPATFNSFIDFEQVVAECGGAIATTEADIIGTRWLQTGSSYTETIVFNVNNTFNFIERDLQGTVTDSATGIWSVTKDMITLLVPGVIIDVLAFTPQGQKGYAEEAGWSSNPDLSSLDAAVEGEIWSGDFIKQ